MSLAFAFSFHNKQKLKVTGELGTKQHGDGWDASSKDWAHMCIHLPHAEGGFGVTFNDVTKDAAFYTTTSRFVAWLGAFPQERQKLWLPKDDLRRMVSLSFRIRFPSHFRSLTASLRFPLFGMRALPPMLMFRLSPHS